MNNDELYELEVEAVRKAQEERAQRKKEFEERKKRQEKEEADKAALSEAFLPELPDNSDIRAAARAVERTIFETYYQMMIDPETPAAVRKSCADALADRARGKPAQDGTKKQTDDDKPAAKMTVLKEKILKAIPNDKLDALISEVHEAGLDIGETTPDV